MKKTGWKTPFREKMGVKDCVGKDRGKVPDTITSPIERNPVGIVLIISLICYKTSFLKSVLIAR